MDFASADTASFWIVDEQITVGLIRVLDLGDIGTGAPLLDFRIATPHRARGIGTQAARWIVHHLFDTYPELHRVEANTRHDNAAMQRVLSKARFTHEGRLREGWSSTDGQRYDTMVYGLLRSDRNSAS